MFGDWALLLMLLAVGLWIVSGQPSERKCVWTPRPVGWAPTLGECKTADPTEDETPAREMFNRLIARVRMSQPVIADTSMFAVASSGAWACESDDGNGKKVGLVSWNLRNWKISYWTWSVIWEKILNARMKNLWLISLYALWGNLIEQLTVV